MSDLAKFRTRMFLLFACCDSGVIVIYIGNPFCLCRSSVSGSSEKRDKKACRAVDLEDLEKEYALTKARLQLAHSEVKHLVIGEYKSTFNEDCSIGCFVTPN